MWNMKYACVLLVYHSFSNFAEKSLYNLKSIVTYWLLWFFVTHVIQLGSDNTWPNHYNLCLRTGGIMAAVSLRKEVNEQELLSCCIAMKKAKSNKITKATNFEVWWQDWIRLTTPTPTPTTTASTDFYFKIFTVPYFFALVFTDSARDLWWMMQKVRLWCPASPLEIYPQIKTEQSYLVKSMSFLH